jgi:hypothetical protein
MDTKLLQQHEQQQEWRQPTQQLPAQFSSSLTSRQVYVVVSFSSIVIGAWCRSAPSVLWVCILVHGESVAVLCRLMEPGCWGLPSHVCAASKCGGCVPQVDRGVWLQCTA